MRKLEAVAEVVFGRFGARRMPVSPMLIVPASEAGLTQLTQSRGRHLLCVSRK
jgi:hypothetical protein